MAEIPSSENISTKLRRIAELAKQMPEKALHSLSHYIDLEWMREAYRRTRKDGAPGVDGQTAKEYASDLDANLSRLLDRAKSGTYRAPPVRRVHIPKGDGKETRPIGIPTFEDKVLQRAVAMVLEAVYEQDFLDCSYGFRPGRSPHQALAALREPLMAMHGGCVVEIDIRKFFDTVDRGRLREILRRRVRDGVLLRLIGKWLNAGVLEEGQLSFPDAGTPQGGVISPLLANIYLHEVLDTWFHRDVRPRMRGRAFLVRFADDAVLCFESEDDARRVLDVLPKRFGKYGLTLHPEKTRLVRFGRPVYQPESRRRTTRATRPGTFDFLGFTHLWARSRQGFWVVKRQTAASRFRRKLREISLWCARHRHEPVVEQHATLAAKLQGHYAYYGITGNASALGRFRHAVARTWGRWLRRRGERRRSWARTHALLDRFPFPVAVAIHSALRRRAAKP
jgi:group II intron reverse transcriptase/maturase